jgi:predicted metal-dependent hydrolase
MNAAFGAVNYGREKVNFSVLYLDRETLAIEVHPDGTVLVKAPADTNSAEIENRVIKRVRWILKQLRYFQQFYPRTPKRQFLGGETHLYLGRQFRLKVGSGRQDSVKLTRGYFVIETTGEISPAKTEKLLGAWYAAKAAAIFRESLERCWSSFERNNPVKPRLLVRRLRKRWGSLSKSGALTLNMDLIRAPKECIDYVITHELCHLRFHDHGPDFYRLLEKVMPDWEKRKHKLELMLV